MGCDGGQVLAKGGGCDDCGDQVREDRGRLQPQGGRMRDRFGRGRYIRGRYVRGRGLCVGEEEEGEEDEDGGEEHGCGLVLRWLVYERMW